MKLFIIALLLTSVSCLAQEIAPQNGIAPSSARAYALKNATIIISPEKTIEKGTLLIEGDRITAVGTSVTIPADAVEIDCQGKTILPAFIECNSAIGLPRPSGNRSWTPQLETSKKGAYYWNEAIHPEVAAAQLYVIDEKANTDLLKMGFGLVSTHVQDGIAQGSAALVSLGKSNYNKQLIHPAPASYFSFRSGVSAQTYPSSQMGSIALLRQTLYDLQWYSANPKAEKNLSLDALALQLKSPLIFHTEDKLEILRGQKIGKEFDLNFAFIGSGNEYEAINELKKLKNVFILPLNFPAAYDVKDPYISRQIPLSDLKHWELAPSNPALLRQAGLSVILSSAGLAAPADFWKNLQKAMSRGLTQADALKALTTEPAKLLGVDADFGTLEVGKKASFMVYDNDPFRYEANVLEGWLLGEQTILQTAPTTDIRGKYNLLLDTEKIALDIEGTKEKPTAKFRNFRTTTDSLTGISKKDTVTTNCYINVIGNDLTLQFVLQSDKIKGNVSLHGKTNAKLGLFEGDGILPNGNWVRWSAIRNKYPEKDAEKVSTVKADTAILGKTWFPNTAYGFDSIPKKQTIVIENATFWTNEAAGRIENATLILENGKIKYLGTGTFTLPNGALRIDAKGKHVTSGIIDEHSHIAISKGVNEGGQSISAEVSIGDVLNSDDINIYRQLSGGVTAAQLLHGSANPIGGQSALVKLKWGHTPEEMLIPNAPKFIKFALGENVKQANWGDFNTVRFPQTRMGVEQVFYDGFERARIYSENLKNWNAASEKQREKKGLEMPRKDLELEVLSEILRSERFITCHSYVQSEVNMLIHVADSMHFTLNTFTHILEGYKVADKLKQHGAGASTFADWWGYKFEVSDAIPYNAAMLHQQGVVTAINSDDAEMGRRLNQEAAKVVKYGGVSEEEAWKMVTLNPAKLLHLDEHMGSLKVGKDADVVIWTTNPLSIEAKVEMTIVDGEVLFDSKKDYLMRTANQAEKARIISKMLSTNQQGETAVPFVKKKKRQFHCNTLGEEASEDHNEH